MASFLVEQVAAWMVGIKRLIQEARNVAPPVSPTSVAANTIPLSTGGDTPGSIQTCGDPSMTDGVVEPVNNSVTCPSVEEKANLCVHADGDKANSGLPTELQDTADKGEHPATISLS